MELTAEQQRVVVAAAPFAVEGLPGSGRTTALVARAARLLRDRLEPARLLMLVRDRREAGRVRGLVAAALGRSTAEPSVATVTGFAAGLLRAEAAGARSVLSAPEARALVGDLVGAEGDDLWPGFSPAR